MWKRTFNRLVNWGHRIGGDRKDLGTQGEKLAARLLRDKGHRIVTRNFHCDGGELDLVTLDGKTIVFVEVKTRRDRDHADPQDAVNRVKRQRMERAARFFLRLTGSEARDCRFDIVAVVMAEDGNYEIEHLDDAFAPGRL